MLRNLVVVIAVAVLAVLSGCAELQKKQAFIPESMPSARLKRVEPYQAMAIDAKVVSPAGVAVSFVPLSERLSRELLELSKDKARPYDTEEITLRARNAKGEVVYKAILYRGSVLPPNHKAFLDRSQKRAILARKSDQGTWQAIRSIDLPAVLHGNLSAEGQTAAEFRITFDREIKSDYARRDVFRGIPYDTNNVAREELMFDVVSGPAKKELRLLMSSERAELLRGMNTIIASPAGDFVITLQGERVSIDKEKGLDRLPAKFFEEHPSRLDDLIIMTPWTEPGQRFINWIQGVFPYEFEVRGRQYLGQYDARIVLQEYTPLNETADKVLSCTSFMIDTLSVVDPVVTNSLRLGKWVYDAVKADLAPDCLAEK